MGNIGNITKPFNRFIYCFYEGKLSVCLLKFMFEFAPANCENYSVILKKTTDIWVCMYSNQGLCHSV